MTRFEEQMQFYQQQHQSKANKITHYIGIPVLIFASLLLLNWLRISLFFRWEWSFSWLVILAAVIYYAFLHFRLAILAAVVFSILNWIAIVITAHATILTNIVLFVVLFAGGWALQLLGHYLEKNKPALAVKQPLAQIFIAPLFLLLEAVSALGFENYFV